MNQKLTERLYNKFPLLYQDKDKSPKQSLMCFGFECSDGWFNLIYELSSKLEPMIQKFIDTNPDVDGYVPRAIQVKEKYGTLRFYITTGTDEMFDIIEEAETKSADICENCGKPGKMRSDGYWLSTQCDKCWEK